MTPFLLSSIVSGPLLLGIAAASPPAGDDGAPTSLSPIATSRFAPSTSEFRELRSIGEPAPPLPTGPAIVGTPPTELGRGQRTILLFWSPSDPTAGQHLAALHRNDAANEGVEGLSISLGSEAETRAYLATLNRRISPPTTIADEEATSRRTYLEPLGLSALPCVVVVDEDGTIIYHGGARESALTIGQIAAGVWNPDRYVGDALQWGARQNVLREVSRLQGLSRRGRATTDEIVQLLDEATALDPKNEVFQVKKFDALLLDPDRVMETYEHGRAVMARFPRSALTLNDLAWHVVSFPSVGHRDLDFALEASRRSNALQGWTNAGALDTLARIHWLRGDPEEAVRWQRKAVSQAADSWFGDEARENLRVYTDGSLAPGEMPRPYVSPRRPAR